MPQQSLDLEQTDFSGGINTDVNPLRSAPNTTVDEQNFQIEKDGSRRRRNGILFDQDQNGNIYTPDADFYSEYRARSTVYSTISPNASAEVSYTARKPDVVTITDDGGAGGLGRIKSFDAEDTALPEIAHSAINGTGPFYVTQHVTSQVYLSAGSPNKHIVSTIYGYDSTAQELGVTAPNDLEYTDPTGATVTLSTADARTASTVSWSSRMVYAFNSADDTKGYGIGISALPDPTDDAATQNALLAKCRQVSGGTDPVGTDGTWLYAGDLGKIERLVPFRTGLLVFTTENIWFLSAINGYFDPYNFGFDKLTDTRVTSANSIVTADNVVLFWAESALYAITPDENSGLPALRNLSEGRVQKLYENILFAAKQQARGVYNKERQEVRWLYSLDPTDFDRTNRLRFEKELVLDLTTGAFTVNSFNTSDDTYIIDYIPDNAAEQDFEGANVVTSTGDPITATIDSVEEEVYATFLTTFSITSNYKYVVRDGTTQARVGALSDTSFLDFDQSVGFPTGTDAAAYMKTGWFTFTGTQRKKTPNWLTTTFVATETGYDDVADELLNRSGCQVTTYWDYANNLTQGKKHGPYQAYRLHNLYMPETTEWNYGQDFVSTKNKIRGRGRTIQFLFETEEGKDCQFYSWGFNGAVLTRI